MIENDKRLQYGFRHDPIQWVENDTSLFAAFVRTRVLSSPNNGDREILDTVINKILAKQQPDGSLGEDSKDTGSKLLDLLELGIDHNRPEVKKAAEAIVRQIQTNPNSDEGPGWDRHVLSIYAIHALWLLGKKDIPEMTSSLRWLLDHQDKWNDPWKGCPWTPEVFFSGLWTAREFPDAREAVQQGLRRVLKQMNDAGSCAYNDPWGFIDAASRIDLPEARELIARQIPMILRNQQPNSGWRHRSPETFRALTTHGLFDQLRSLPPLPPDWSIIQEFSLPEGKWVSLTWDGKHIWSFNREHKRAVALSPEDGTVFREINIEHCDHIAWADGSLITVCNEPKILQTIDPRMGKILKTRSIEFVGDVCDCEVVQNKIIIGDGFECNVWIIDPDSIDKWNEQVLAGAGPEYLAAQDNSLWHVDLWSHCLIRSGMDGRLLDWGEKPFWDVTGLAFDGEHLWVLDGKNNCIRAIEKSNLSS